MLNKLNTFDEVMINKEVLDDSINEYYKNVREFFKHFKEDRGFNGVVNTIELKKSTHPLYSCELIIGYQELPMRAVMDFCDVFDYLMPNIKLKPNEDIFFPPDYEYSFKKRRNNGRGNKE